MGPLAKLLAATLAVPLGLVLFVLVIVLCLMSR